MAAREAQRTASGGVVADEASTCPVITLPSLRLEAIDLSNRSHPVGRPLPSEVQGAVLEKYNPILHFIQPIMCSG